ncbi:hypothetical protein LSUB1_G004172, partial [Lachnellula subtilissima]
MLCAECSHPLPTNRTPQTICAKCKTPLATWWDETTQTHRTNRESIMVETFDINAKNGALGNGYGGNGKFKRRNVQSIEEKSFNGALVAVKGHFEGLKFGPKSSPEVRKMVAGTLDKSLNAADVRFVPVPVPFCPISKRGKEADCVPRGKRERLAKNIDIWQRLRQIFILALPKLSRLSLRESYDVPESATLILNNYAVLKEDLQYLNNLLVISRNMLAIKETAQEICARVGFDEEVRMMVVLCVNVTSKGYDGESVGEGIGGDCWKLQNFVHKKLLVTCLQHTHNWTMGNDRFKMSFWFEMLFDEGWDNELPEIGPDGLDVRKVHQEVKNWLRRHNKRNEEATRLLATYEADVPTGDTPGPLPEEEEESRETVEESTTPIWTSPEMEDKYQQDKLYARVSHQIDVWWKRVRDANYDGWVVPMETVEGARERADQCKENAMQRYIPSRGDQDRNYDNDEQYEEQQPEGALADDENDARSLQGEHGDEEEDEEEEEDEDDSYVEGPLRGLLTEIPNILDTKQIEALHMTVKACIVDSMGSGLTPAGENLQKTRCKMFLALDCGKNLLREMLVFIAVWEQTDQQFIFQITAQIIESFHHNALLPYAWNCLRILKDIVSPAQTVLLRLINYMFRARKDSPIYDDLKDYNRDAKLIHFLYNYFRCRVVPDCVALIHAQAQIRTGKTHPSEFPVDLWDMERAKDGLSQYLDFISVIAEIPEMRHLLIEWDCVYELITLLKNLEAGVARKGLDEKPQANVPPLHDTPHKFPWAGIKIQILIILTSLLAPTNVRRTGPGNPIVQKQLLDHTGIMPLLNCCVYDGYNEYLKERATLAIKFVMEGCEEAQKFVRELVPMKQAQARAQQERAQMGAQGALSAEAELARRLESVRMAGLGGGVGGGSVVEGVKSVLREKGHVVEGDEDAK